MASAYFVAPFGVTPATLITWQPWENRAARRHLGEMVVTAVSDAHRIRPAGPVRMNAGEIVRVALFYVVATVAMIIIATKHTADILPTHLAHQVADNSEGYLIGAGACLWLHFGRRIPRRTGGVVAAALVVGAICLALGIIFKEAGWPSSVGTLNEGWFGLAFLVPYFVLPRPLRWAPLFSVAVLIFLLAGHNLSIVVKGAEAWMVLLLAPIGFDVFDRAIVDRNARESHVGRLIWMAILVGVPVLAVALHHHLGHGHVAGTRDYVSRANEAFVGLLIIHAYCGYWARSALASNRSASTAA